MSENEPTAVLAEATATDEELAAPPPTEVEALAEVEPEEIVYHAVEKDGQVSAIWEMQGRKHLRTIDPRSRQGEEILRLYTTEHTEGATTEEAEAEESDAEESDAPAES